MATTMEGGQLTGGLLTAADAPDTDEYSTAWGTPARRILLHAKES